jgi:hypothetical protein
MRPWRNFPSVAADFIRHAKALSAQNGMIGKDPVLSWFLVATFAMGSISAFVHFHATAKLAMWLYREHRDIWLKLDSPGTTFFKGDPDNGYLRRTSALQRMYRMMPLHAYHRQLSHETAQRILNLHRVAGIVAVIAMVLFFIEIIYGVVREGFDSHSPQTQAISSVAFLVSTPTLSQQLFH